MRNLVWLCTIVAGAQALSLAAAQFKIGAHNFTLPDGFVIELVAGTSLVPRPIEADFDEQGRLYVTDSSGSNDKIQKQLEDKPHRIMRLEDTDGDGHFDKSITFADKMMFPEGAMWRDGSLYVAAPPSIWKLTDTNSDGVADVRVEWFKGETLTGCANDLHGPYAGPDGWIYWCKGAFAKQTYVDREVPGLPSFSTRAAHIFRARPDGKGIEPVLTGGMDNPVGLTFTTEGERILSGTFFLHPAGGQRDGLIHALYGGVYGKDHDVIEGHARTGDLMPIMTHLGPAAPAGLMRYESTALGKEFQDNFFVACFNLHKVARCIPQTHGASYRTIDSDFVVSDNTDFHPTDVFEDADGSLIVIDTGGWYKLCCPTSQLHKPDVLGGIYRIRRQGAPPVADPRGLRISWNTLAVSNLVVLFDDPRPVVQRRAIAELLRRRGEESIHGLSETVRRGKSPLARRNAVWALSQWDSAASVRFLATALADPDESVVHAALTASATHRSPHVDEYARQLLEHKSPAIRRATAECLGRVEGGGTDWLLAAVGRADVDRTLEHSIIYALIQNTDREGTRRALASTNVMVRRAALIALDQMPKGGLTAEDVTPFLASTNALLRQTASWIIGQHRDWATALGSYFTQRLREALPASDENELVQQLAQFGRDEGIQETLARTIRDGTSLRATKVALRAMARTGVREVPAVWTAELARLLASASDGSVIQQAVATIRALPAAKTNVTELNAALLAVAERLDLPPTLRVAAAAGVSGGIRNLSEPLYSRLVGTLLTDNTVSGRADAAHALARARLSNARLLELAAHMKRVGPMELPRVLPAFAQSTNEMVGLRLVESLQESKFVQSVRPETLRPAITNFPPAVHQRAEVLLASLNTDAAQQKVLIDEMLVTARNGDVRRGQALFNSAQTACSSCHAIGYLGGNVGPDLTRIGQVRNERDLLEAILYPNASFVRSYEPVMVTTKAGDEFSGVLKRDAADEVVLVTGPNTEQRIARADVADMRPGTVSVMPSGLADQLSKEEVADLLAFLKATRW